MAELVEVLNHFQPVNWWFGARWVFVCINPFHEGIPGIQTTKQPLADIWNFLSSQKVKGGGLKKSASGLILRKYGEHIFEIWRTIFEKAMQRHSFLRVYGDLRTR